MRKREEQIIIKHFNLLYIIHLLSLFCFDSFILLFPLFLLLPLSFIFFSNRFRSIKFICSCSFLDFFFSFIIECQEFYVFQLFIMNLETIVWKYFLFGIRIQSMTVYTFMIHNWTNFCRSVCTFFLGDNFNFNLFSPGKLTFKRIKKKNHENQRKKNGMLWIHC